MDVFYEESAVDRNSTKGARKYRIVHIISVVVLILAILFLMFGLFNMPFGGSGAEIESMRFLAGFCLFQGAFFLVAWFLLGQLKKRFNVSYDYCFVSGELRISKVFNINRRRLVARIDSEDIIQIGDIDNSAYPRLKTDPNTKEVICTPNIEADTGKFFMYILAEHNGKKLFVLECRELLLMNILKFARRTTLESDYVMQERKQK